MRTTTPRLFISAAMIYPILRYGHPVLRRKGAPILHITPEIHQLAKDMLETMRGAHGVGLAAQQIGQALQICVIDVTGVKERESRMWIGGKPVKPEDHMPLVLLNPEISGTKSKEIGPEGCLSFPGLSADVARSTRVKCKAKLLDGKVFEFEAGGLLGRAVQHEYDHLHGKLFTDLLSAQERRERRQEIEDLRTDYPE
ncbi:MAG: peptide deformylase [Candidatus Methylacidiphilales bacterium]|nr:peptide deformylase [Candidatus Methylacidiphilales bacterium]